MDKDWKFIAEKYQDEIYNLWNDIEEIKKCLMNIMPRDLERARSLIKTSLESSQKAMYEIEKFG